MSDPSASAGVENAHIEMNAAPMPARPDLTSETASAPGDEDRRTKMDSAMDAALRAMSGSGAAPPDAATIAAARARAQQMVESMPGGAQGMRDLQNMTLTMGMPAAQNCFRHMIAASGIRGAKKAEAMREVSEFTPVTERGRQRIEFWNIAKNRRDVVYVWLDQCPRTFNFGSQLAKLQGALPADKMQSVMREISWLFNFGRKVYSELAEQKRGLIRRIFGLAATDPCTQYLNLQIDMASTTLFLDPTWPNRIGIFIEFEDEGA